MSIEPTKLDLSFVCSIRHRRKNANYMNYRFEKGTLTLATFDLPPVSCCAKNSSRYLKEICDETEYADALCTRFSHVFGARFYKIRFKHK